MNTTGSKNSQFKLQFKKRCFDFSIQIVALYDEFRNKRVNWILLDQLIRCATSIGANVVEGGSGASKKIFSTFSK